MTLRNPHIKRADKESGFVLPYVLVVIAILSVAGTIAAQRLTRAANVVADMRMKSNSELILHSAEAAATYALLTGNPIKGGYDLDPKSPIFWEFGAMAADGRRTLNAQQIEDYEADFWHADGGVRRYIVNQVEANVAPQLALIRLQDATGLVSINTGRPADILKVMRASGANQSQAQTLYNRLRDYTDSDSKRRDNGAELPSYRREKLSPPSNAPLRSFEELGAVYGWQDASETIDLRKLADLTTVFSTSGYRESFATPEQKRLLGIKSNSLLGAERISMESSVERVLITPSGYARFTFYAPRPDGRLDKRVMDIQRFTSGIGAPYRKRWVYDSTVLETDFVKNNGLHLNGPSDGNDGLNINGLKDVVHTASPAR